MLTEALTDLVEHGQLSQALDAMADGLTFTGPDGSVLYVNQAYYKMSGLSPELVESHTIFQLHALGYPVAQLHIQVFGKREVCSQLIQYHNNSEQKILVTAAPYYNGSGDFLGVVCNFRDITHLMDLRREMSTFHLQSEAELQQQRTESRELALRINELRYAISNYDLIGESLQMRRLAELAYRICNVQSTVLITGESGVGKDVFCQMVHNFWGKDRPYIKVSCGAIPENLLESELFGYEPGAFTGASRQGKPGIFELAKDGILFLDEIGEMPLSLQVKLLTVIQDRKFFRLGGTKELQANARIIAATNRNLKEEVAAGRFRMDLYYRLNVIPVYVPPLRERKEDILTLADYVLGRLNQANGTHKVIGSDLERVLNSYPWPGNIRELNNVIERMYILSAGDVLGTDDLPEELSDYSPHETALTTGYLTGTLKEAMAQVEAELIRNRLREDLTLQEVADQLDIDLSTLMRKIRKYNLPKRYKTKEES